MKTSSIAFAFLISGIISLGADQGATTSPQTGQEQNVPAPTAFRVVDHDGNSRVWQRETYQKAPNGQVSTIIHKVTELASGMYYKNAQGEWTESKDEVDAYPQGAIANQGPYQVIFADNLNSAGAIDMQTPDGKRLRSNLLGLLYHDTASDRVVQIGEIQDSTGQLTDANQVVYTNAFSGVSADVRYIYQKSRFEQDVILRAQLPTPESLGMNSDTVELEVMTEFLTPPQETITTIAGVNDAQVDQEISWGAMTIGRGKAFDLGQQPSPRPRVTVTKEYVTVEGRRFLLEKVPVKNIQSSLQNLPLHASLERQPSPRKTGHGSAPANTSLPLESSKTLPLPKPRLAHAFAKPMRLALSSPTSQGYVLDYVVVSSGENDFTFRGDTTYYVSGEYNLTGRTTLEGGTVIKLDSGGQIDIDGSGTIVCRTAPYQPAVFTSINDDSVGEIVSGSSGAPATYDVGTCLNLNCPTAILSNMRFSYGNYCVLGNTLDMWDCQAVAVDVFVWVENLGLHNVLVQENPEIYDNPVWAENVIAENVTCDGVSRMVELNDSDGTDYQTNCIITNGQYYNTNGGSASIYSSQPFYQTAGAGSYYLATNSNFRNIGTTNISPALLADIRTKTTYPPMVYSTIPMAGGTFSPCVQRDTDTPDLGYHYDPLDYCFGGVNAPTNSVFTFTAGTTVGWFEPSGQPYGISLPDGASVKYAGTVSAPCVQARYSTVQEGGNGNWTYMGNLGCMDSYGSATGDDSIAAKINATFTLFACHAWQPSVGQAYSSDVIYNLTHCVVNGGSISSYDDEICLTNCLLLGMVAGVQSYETPGASLTLVNCTMHEGRIISAHFGSSTWPSNIRNCAFENVDFSQMYSDGETTDPAVTYYDYNAYVTNTTTATQSQLPMSGGHDVLVTNFNWQTSWLGNYYLPTNSWLINTGSITADVIGLYHFTTQTTQVKETNSTVDIGYHYVAVTNGIPFDTNTDGIPDYLEDANGNGLVDSGEIGWNIVGDLGLQVFIIRPRNGSNLP